MKTTTTTGRIIATGRHDTRYSVKLTVAELDEQGTERKRHTFVCEHQDTLPPLGPNRLARDTLKLSNYLGYVVSVKHQGDKVLSVTHA